MNNIHVVKLFEFIVQIKDKKSYVKHSENYLQIQTIRNGYIITQNHIMK